MDLPLLDRLRSLSSPLVGNPRASSTCQIMSTEPQPLENDKESSSPETAHPNQGFLSRAHRFFAYMGGVYATVLILLMFPFFRRHLLYIHAANFPLNAKFDLPQKYGLAPHKVVNLSFNTTDNERVGAWFVMSDAFYQSAVQTRGERYDVFSGSDLGRTLLDHPTIMYFHGNAANRAAPSRVSLYTSMSTRLGANVLAIDYRGFGDSSGTPSEAGLGKDARAAWDWLISRGVAPENVLIMGQSLGSAVATMLAAELAQEDIQPRGLALVAAFTSIPTLLETFKIGGVLPFLRPLMSFPYAFNVILYFLHDEFDTLSRIQHIKAPVLLVHCEKDNTIPARHSSLLFDSLLEHQLPVFPFTHKELLRPTLPGEEFRAILEKSTKDRNAARSRLIKKQTITDYGVAWEFERPGGAKVKHVETLWGGHTDIVRTEGLADLVGDFFDIHRS